MSFRRLALASAACAVACGRPAPRAAGPSLITITATDYAFGVPDTIPAGLTTFRLVNQGKELHHANLVRLGEGKTVADFQAGLAAAMKNHTPPPTWMGFAGGPNAVTLGDTGVATQTLEPGSYVFVCWIPSLDGVPHVMKGMRSEEHTSELQSRLHLVCRLLLEKKKERGELGATGLTQHARVPPQRGLATVRYAHRH